MSSHTRSLFKYFNITETSGTLAGLYSRLGDKSVFIVPSGLDKESLLNLISRGGSYFGARPRIATLSELYRELSRAEGSQRHMVDPPDHKMIVRYVLDSFMDKMKRAGHNLPPGVEHRGFASILSENIHDLIVEEISPEYLSGKILSVGDDDAAPEAMLNTLYSEYLGYLNGNNLTDNAQIPSLLTEMLCSADGAHVQAKEFISSHEFVIVGFLSFTGGQHRFFEKLTSAAACHFIMPITGMPDFRSGIKQMSLDAEDCCADRRRVLKTAKLSGNDAHLEFSAIARELALWICGLSGLEKLGALKDYGQVGIQVSDGQMPVLENQLSRYKIPYSEQVRGTAGETGLGKLPRSIWSAYSSGWDTKETAFMFSDALISDETFNTVEYLNKFTRGAKGWELVLPEELRGRFTEIQDFCKEMHNGGTAVCILTLWRDLLLKLDVLGHAAHTAGEEIQLDDTVKDISASLAELDKKIITLGDASMDIGLAAGGILKDNDAISYITEWSGTATLPIPLPQSGSVTLYAGMPPVSACHDYLIMTDIDSTTWPGTLRESPLLSDEKLALLNASDKGDSTAGTVQPHLPDIREQRQQKEAIFRRLTAVADKGVIIARSMTDSSGRPVGESQFTARLFECGKDNKFNNIEWLNVSSGSDKDTIEYTVSRSMPRACDDWFRDAEVPAAVPALSDDAWRRGQVTHEQDEQFAVRLSGIDAWALCPYRYWCREVLRLEPGGESQLYNVRAAGTLLHALWLSYWTDVKEKPALTFQNHVIASWHDTVMSEYPELENDTRLKRHNKELHKKADGTAALQDGIEKNLKALGRCEVRTEYELPEYRIDDVPFTGRCDRIDIYPNGAVILDYKLGNAENHKEELQLAAYAAILKDTEKMNILGFVWLGHKTPKTAGYFSDGAGNLREAYFCGNGTKGETLESMIEKARNAMKSIAECLSKHEPSLFKTNYSATKNKQSLCSSCSYSTLCRKRKFQTGGESEDWQNGDEQDG